MKTGFSIATLLITMLIWLTPISSFGTESAEALFNEEEGLLLEMINKARQNPRQAVVDLGMDPDQVLGQSPELADVFLHGLAPLAPHPALVDSALKHAADMLDRGYLSRISPEGIGPLARMRQSGFEPYAGGESLGIVTFMNFFPAKTAVTILFSNMLKAELEPSGRNSRTILNPEFRAVGIGYVAGKYVLNGRKTNAYLAVCDFALQADTGYSSQKFKALIESELKLLLNQARVYPQAAIREAAWPQFKDNAGLQSWLVGNAPLVESPELTVIARAHAEDMLGSLVLDSGTSDGKDFASRFEGSSYDPAKTGEVLGIVLSDEFLSPQAAALQLYHYMFNGEIFRTITNMTASQFFQDQYSEMGLAIAFGKVMVDGLPKVAYMATLDLSITPADSPRDEVILGVIYVDQNADGLYSPGEGLAGHALLVDSPARDLLVETGRFGEFSLASGRGDTRLTVQWQNETVEQWVCPQDRPVWADIALPPDAADGP